MQDLVILECCHRFRDPLSHPGANCHRNLDDWKLEQQELPSQAAWDTARERAGLLFGNQASNLCSATNLDKFGAEVLAAAAERRTNAQQLLTALKRVVPSGANRLVTGNASVRLLDKLDSKLKPIEVVNRLHAAEIATSLAAMERSMSRATGVLTAIEHAGWTLFEGLKSIPESAHILTRLNEGLATDEYVLPLADRLRECSADAARLLIERTPPRPAPEPEPQAPPADIQPAPIPSGKRTVAKATKQTTSARLPETLAELQRTAKAHPDADIEITWEIRE